MKAAGLAIVALLLGSVAPVQAQAVATPPAVLPDSLLSWRPAGPGLQLARLEGDPSVADAPYALMLRLADGGWIPPHFHPGDKRVVVVSGTLLLGFGDAVAEDAAALGPGSFALVPAGAHHFEGARGKTTFVLYGTGPLTTTMVRQE